MTSRERRMKYPRLKGVAALLVILVTLSPVSGHAHVLRFGTMQLEQAEGIAWRLSLRYSGADEELSALETAIPDNCQTRGPTSERHFGNGLTRDSLITCDTHGAPAWIDVKGLQDGARLRVRFTPSEGPNIETFITARDPRFVTGAPALQRTPDTVTYFGMGVEHLLTGLDHLAFLLLVTLGAGSLWTMATMASAFTLGHSLTLAATTLGLMTVNPSIVEALIALSIVLLAADLCARQAGAEPAKPRAAAGTVASAPPGRQSQWLMPALFGLVHGMGFADILRETGLPEQDRLLALLMFNLGIEAGQLAFVALIVITLGWLTPGWRHRVAGALVNLSGLAGGCWLLSRLA